MTLTQLLHPHRHIDPDMPVVPLGGSKNEMMALLLVLFVVLVVVASFWLEATH